MEIKWFHNGDTYSLWLGFYTDKDGDEVTPIITMEQQGPRRNPIFYTVMGGMNVAERNPTSNFATENGARLVEFIFTKFDRELKQEGLNEI